MVLCSVALIKSYFQYFVSWWTNSKVKHISMSSFVKKIQIKLHMVYTLTMIHIRVNYTSLSIILTFCTILPVRIFSWSPYTLRMACIVGGNTGVSWVKYIGNMFLVTFIKLNFIFGIWFYLLLFCQRYYQPVEPNSYDAFLFYLRPEATTEIFYWFSEDPFCRHFQLMPFLALIRMSCFDVMDISDIYRWIENKDI